MLTLAAHTILFSSFYRWRNWNTANTTNTKLAKLVSDYSLHPEHILLKMCIYFYLTGDYNIVLASTIRQHGSAIVIHMSPPSWVSCPPPTPSYHSRLSQSPSLSSLSHTANSHWLSILHMLAYMFPRYSLHLSHSLLPTPPPCVPYVCISIQFSSVAQSCLTLFDPMGCSTPGFPVHHQLPELAQTRPSSRWCHPAISSSVVPFSSCPQSLLASGSLPMSQFFSISIAVLQIGLSVPSF